ncbi:MAG: GAF domain-containing sensor histidine kinase [Armatimonadota bacterium]
MVIQYFIVIALISIVSVLALLLHHARKHTGWPVVWPVLGVLFWFSGLSLPYVQLHGSYIDDFPRWTVLLLLVGSYGFGCSLMLIFALYPGVTWAKSLGAGVLAIIGFVPFYLQTSLVDFPRYRPLTILSDHHQWFPSIANWLLSCSVLALGYFAYLAIQARGQQRVQFRYTLAGMSLVCLGVIIQFVLFVPRSQIPALLLPTIACCCGILLLTYAHTARYPLLDGRLLLRPFLTFTITLVMVTGLYLWVGRELFKFLLSTLIGPYQFQSLFYSILQATTFLVLYPLIAVIVQRYLLRFPYDARKTLSRTSAALLSVYDTDGVTECLSNIISETIRPAGCALYLCTASDGLVRRGKPSGGDPLPVGLPLANAIWQQLSRGQEVLLGEELRRYRDHNAVVGTAMLEAGAAVAVPLITNGQTRGCLLCTEKLSGDGYTQQDLQVLTALCQQTSLALENVEHHEELATLNAQLEARVAERTRELAEANSQLQQANQAKDFFLALVSHELLNPLTGIMGWADVGLRTEDPQMRAQVIATIHQNGLRLKRLVYDLLDTARMIHGKLTIEPEPLDLWYVAKSAMNDMGQELQVKRLEIVYQPPDEPLPILADSGRMQQVVDNLLGNAIKFTPAGGTLTLTGERDGDRCKLSITDTGKGIPADKLTRIFERFQQVPGDHKAGGLGLGLALVRGIMDLHNGTVSAVSAGQGQGSTFTIALPVHVPAPEDMVEAPVTATNAAGNME